jgi:translation initiation factor IF-2
VAYTGPSSRPRGSLSLAPGLRTANLSLSPAAAAAADGAQHKPAGAAVAAASITGRMPGRAAQASPAAPWPRTGPQGPCTSSCRQRSPGPQRSPGRPAPGARSFWPTRDPGGAVPTAAAAATAAAARKRLPGGGCSPTPPTLRPAPATRPAGLCAAPACPPRVGARRRLSPRLLPFAAPPSPSARPGPPSSRLPTPAAASLGAGGATRLTAALLGPPAAGPGPWLSARTEPGRGCGMRSEKLGL